MENDLKDEIERLLGELMRTPWTDVHRKQALKLYAFLEQMKLDRLQAQVLIEGHQRILARRKAASAKPMLVPALES